jgi:hypothetical protein
MHVNNSFSPLSPALILALTVTMAVSLSNYQIAELSNSSAVSLSNYQIIELSNCFIAELSNCFGILCPVLSRFVLF